MDSKLKNLIDKETEREILGRMKKTPKRKVRAWRVARLLGMDRIYIGWLMNRLTLKKYRLLICVRSGNPRWRREYVINREIVL